MRALRNSFTNSCESHRDTFDTDRLYSRNHIAICQHAGVGGEQDTFDTKGGSHSEVDLGGPRILNQFFRGYSAMDVAGEKKLSWSCLIAFFPLCPGVESGPPALGFQGLNSPALPASLV